jgi:hypothetical protein
VAKIRGVFQGRLREQIRPKRDRSDKIGIVDTAGVRPIVRKLPTTIGGSDNTVLFHLDTEVPGVHAFVIFATALPIIAITCWSHEADQQQSHEAENETI